MIVERSLNMQEKQIQEFSFLMNKMRLLIARRKQKLEVPQAEFAVLVAIVERSRMLENGEEMSASTSEVAKHMGATMPAASKTIRNLTMKGYVKQMQSQTDRRIIHLALTEKGKEILQKSNEKRHEIMQGVFEKFGEVKTAQLLKLMSELFDLMEKEAEEKDV